VDEKNKNEILGLTNARLIKEKQLNGLKYFRDIELIKGIQTNANNGEFVLVLRTDGRIVAMSDEVEHHLGKSMRSLYTQCINIFECLDINDGNKLRKILALSNQITNQEHRLVCTFRLPKGKRPSRAREDIKAISMAGHFYSCHDSNYERLFIARCEALVSRTTSSTITATNGTSSSQPIIINNTMIKLTLNDDMTINMVSPNVKDILGYTRNEIIGNWFGRFLATNDLEKFEETRQRYFQNDQQASINVCDIYDIYTNNGENRLTFLCQIRSTRERRSKLVKYLIMAQLIDPSMRDEYMQHIDDKPEPNQVEIKVEQVNLVSPKTSEDTIMANSPSLAMGLLMFDNSNNNEFFHQQQLSPCTRSLSNVVAPFIFDDESSTIIKYEYEQCPININMQYSPTKIIDDTYMKYQLEQELASIDALIDDF
jgi:PAS domain-containing protein